MFDKLLVNLCANSQEDANKSGSPEVRANERVGKKSTTLKMATAQRQRDKQKSKPLRDHSTGIVCAFHGCVYCRRHIYWSIGSSRKDGNGSSQLVGWRMWFSVATAAVRNALIENYMRAECRRYKTDKIQIKMERFVRRVRVIKSRRRQSIVELNFRRKTFIRRHSATLWANECEVKARSHFSPLR